jgi:hypothetical protein
MQRTGRRGAANSLLQFLLRFVGSTVEARGGASDLQESAGDRAPMLARFLVSGTPRLCVGQDAGLGVSNPRRLPALPVTPVCDLNYRAG